jgi:hypothetical protein
MVRMRIGGIGRFLGPTGHSLSPALTGPHSRRMIRGLPRLPSPPPPIRTRYPACACRRAATPCRLLQNRRGDHFMGCWRRSQASRLPSWPFGVVGG